MSEKLIIFKNSKHIFILKLSFLLFCTAVLGVLHQRLGMIQFGGMDGSALIQGAWRYALGQKTYVDFICTAPPIFVVPPGLMFKLFGPSWENLVTLGTIFTTTTYFVMFWIFRRMGWSFNLSSGFAFAVECFTMIPLGCWGYNQLAQVAGVIFIGSAMLLIQKPGSRINGALYTSSLILLSWMKPNVAGALILMGFFVCLINRNSRIISIVLSILAGFISIGLMLLSNINPIDLVNSYISASGRVSNQFMFTHCIWYQDKIEVGVILSLLLPVVAAGFLEINNKLDEWSSNFGIILPTLLLSVAAIIGSIVGKISNNENYLTDAPLFIFGTLLIIYNRTHNTTKQSDVGRYCMLTNLQNGLVASCITLLTAYALLIAVSRERIYSIGEGEFFEHTELKSVKQPKFFSGMSVGPNFEKVTTELSSEIRPSSFDSKPLYDIFFGTRMEFGYAAYNCIPAKGMFLWWPTPGETKSTQINEVVQRFKEWAPKKCFFFHSDITYMPAEIIKYLNENYSSRSTDNLFIMTKLN